MTRDDSNYVDAYNGDESIPVFVTFAIEQYKKHKGISGEEASAILADAGVLQHLIDYYDVLHTQGAQWLIAEIDEMVANHNAAK